MATAGPTDAHLSVRDPIEEGEPHTQEEKDALFIGMLRLHIANLIKPLGHAELADALLWRDNLDANRASIRMRRGGRVD